MARVRVSHHQYHHCPSNESKVEEWAMVGYKVYLVIALYVCIDQLIIHVLLKCSLHYWDRRELSRSAPSDSRWDSVY